jgi:DNA-binding transcriptional LysR family regulator
MPVEHRLAARETIRPLDIVGETLIGVPASNAPALRAATDAYGAQLGIDLTPDHEVENPSMAISLVASTGGIALLPLYVRNLLPQSVVSGRWRVRRRWWACRWATARPTPRRCSNSSCQTSRISSSGFRGCIRHSAGERAAGIH